MSDEKVKLAASIRWDDSRCDELKMLQMLILEVLAIDRGNRCLQRIAWCIETAEKLDAMDYARDRAGFVNWLEEIANADRRAAKAEAAP